LEVKSGKPRSSYTGMNAFHKAFKPHRMLVIGEGGIDVEEFLSRPALKVLA